MALWQIPANFVLLYGGGVVRGVQTALGIEPEGRALDDDERNELTKIYQDSLDVDLIRLKFGDAGLFSLGAAPFTHGNTIYILKGWLPDEADANYQSSWRRLLAHESMHVWQYQANGANYMSASIAHQFDGWRKSGSRGAAYDYDSAIKTGQTWARLNPEQQAKLIEDAYFYGLFDDENVRFIPYETDLTDYARDAIKQVRAKQGAP